MTTQIFEIPPLRDVVKRLPQCCIGVSLAGLAFALMVQTKLGLGPWEVLADGIHRQTGRAVGTSAIFVALLTLVTWIPLRQRVGIGTLVSVFLFGIITNLVVPFIPEPSEIVPQVLILLFAVVLWGFGVALYISAGLGPGPRDGIMVALARRGHSVRSARTATEIVVLLLGVSLGGKAGIATLVFALGIGPCIQYFLAHLPQSLTN